MKTAAVSNINRAVVALIRSRYTVDDEMGILRTAPSEEATAYNAWVEECRAWGRGEKSRLPRKSRYIRILLCLDQMLNVIMLDGSEDETVSSHVGRHYPGSWIERIINWLFNDPNHCQSNIEFQFLSESR